MSKANGKQFSMDDYTRKTLEERARLRHLENVKVMREKQEEMFQKYGKRKWLRPLGRMLIPSKLWEKIFSLPVEVVSVAMARMLSWYLFVAIGWRVSLGRWMMMGGVRHNIEMKPDGKREVVVFVGGKEVERFKVVV
jgi:hypothetical protein